MTSAGQGVEAAAAGMEQVAARALWRAASEAYARGASGAVHVFQEAEGVNIRSIWAQTEYPALIRNPNVTSIIYHVVERSEGVATLLIPSGERDRE